MLRVGLVDHHLNNFHANKFHDLLHGRLSDREARIVAAWESDPQGNDWCESRGVTRCESPEAVCAASDVVMVLAPDNISDHLALCERVIPNASRVLVDKFLSTTLDDARRIVELAERHRTGLFSASSLRFAVELEAALEPGEAALEATARGMGDWMNYGVHTVSLILGAMGPGISRVLDTGGSRAAEVTLEWSDGRRAWLECRSASNQWETLGWSFGFAREDAWVGGAVRDYDGFYANLMSRTLTFFETGASPVSTREMLETVAVLEAAARSRARGGEWELIGF